MKYEYRTSSMTVRMTSHGIPLREVDDLIAEMGEDGWEFVQLSHQVTVAGVHAVIVFRRPLAE